MDPDAAVVSLNAYLEKASAPVPAASELIVEANTLIASRVEEKRLLVEQARMEEEMKRQAEEEARRQAEAPPTEATPPTEPGAERVTTEVAAADAGDAGASGEQATAGSTSSPPKKKPKKKPQPQPKKKPDGPARDENFYD